MEPERIAKLTGAQRACLRLVLEHVETKEIARRLGISPIAVTERLRSARSFLGVSRSIDAARLLAAHESGPIRLVDKPIGVENGPQKPPSIPPIGNGERAQLGEPTSLKEQRAVYSVDLPGLERHDPKLSRRVPLFEGVRDDLKPWQIICLCVIVGALAVGAFGLMLKIDYELSISRAPP